MSESKSDDIGYVTKTGYKKDRNEAIYKKRLSGMTLSAIGDMYGLSKDRVRMICMKECRIKDVQEKRAKKKNRGMLLTYSVSAFDRK